MGDMNPSTRTDWALAQLARRGGRRTVAHVSVLEVMTQAEGHLSIQEIYERITEHPSLSLSTVHRIMARLTSAGLVHVLPVPGEARYGLSDHVHGHAICTTCGRVQELSHASLTTIMRLAQQETGFTVPPSGVGLQGLCPDCHAAEARGPDHRHSPPIAPDPV